MSQKQAEYNTWGGARTAGEGKKVGAPRQLKGGQYIKFYLDAETIERIKTMVRSKQAKNQSEAVRDAVKNYPLE